MLGNIGNTGPGWKLGSGHRSHPARKPPGPSGCEGQQICIHYKVGCGCHSDRRATFGVAGLGGGSGAASLAPAGHPLQHMFPQTPSDATPPRYSCITSTSRSSPAQTQRMALLRCLRGSSGAGLRPVHTEGTYVQEGDLLVVPAKRRSPRPASPNAPLLSE